MYRGSLKKGTRNDLPGVWLSSQMQGVTLAIDVAKMNRFVFRSRGYPVANAGGPRQFSFFLPAT
jgi:hypothetical protein